MEQTLTITIEPLKTARLVRKADLTIISKGAITNEAIHSYLSIETDQQVHAFILEGVGAVQRWLDMIGTEDATNTFGILYFSQDIKKAEQDVEWCRPLIHPSRTSSTTSSTSSIPIKKTVRKNLVSSTKNGRNTTSVQKTTAVQKETDTKSRIATAVPKKIPKTTTNTTTTATSTARNSSIKPPTTTTKAAKTMTRRPDAGATQGTKSGLTNAPKKIPASKGGGVTKNTPPVSVITGRTRKTSRVDKKDIASTTAEKKKVPIKKKPAIAVKEKKVVPRVKEVEKTEPSEVVDITPPKEEEDKKEEEIIPSQVEEIEENVSLSTESPITTDEEQVEEEENVLVVIEKEKQEEKVEEKTETETEKVVAAEEEEEDSLSKVDEGIVLDNDELIKKVDERIIEHSISHVSSGSSATTDEHDAEVAATTTKYLPTRKTSATPNYLVQRLSPPRPETPEVDQLRQRFETIIQTPTENKTPSKISPEFVARIKEMKPKGPAGARVKSMVELFMDENLNKWEF